MILLRIIVVTVKKKCVTLFSCKVYAYSICRGFCPRRDRISGGMRAVGRFWGLQVGTGQVGCKPRSSCSLPCVKHIFAHSVVRCVHNYYFRTLCAARLILIGMNFGFSREYFNHAGTLSSLDFSSWILLKRPGAYEKTRRSHPNWKNRIGKHILLLTAASLVDAPKVPGSFFAESNSYRSPCQKKKKLFILIFTARSRESVPKF